MPDEPLIYEVLSVVGEIPEGRAATYGQIARLVGRERNSRLIGRILRMSQWYGEYPCHRVVNHAGRTAPGWPEQPELLRREGVPFKENGCVDLRQCRWDVCYPPTWEPRIRASVVGWPHKSLIAAGTIWCR